MKNLLIILILILFNSCLGSKTFSEKFSSIKKSEKTEVKIDSTSIKETNKEIDDKMNMTIPRSNTGNKERDSIIDARVDAILSRINFEKKSGDNYYKMQYNLLNRQMQMEAKIGETSNIATDSNKEEKIEKSFEEQQNEYWKKKITTLPWWAYLLAFVFAWPTIWKFIKPIVQVATGPTNIVSGIQNIIKSKR